MASVSVGGERFIAKQVEPGCWAVLDRRYQELVGSAERSHERSEQRASALNAANARFQAEGHQLGREERDRLNADLETRTRQR
jgi:hypothetical protein